MKIRLLVSLKVETVNSGHCSILTTPENTEVFWCFQRVKKRNIDRFIFRVTSHSPEHYRIGSSEHDEVGLETVKAWCPRVRLFSSIWKIWSDEINDMLVGQLLISLLHFCAMRQSDQYRLFRFLKIFKFAWKALIKSIRKLEKKNFTKKS